MNVLLGLLPSVLGAALAVWFILWVRKRRREAGHRDEECDS